MGPGSDRSVLGGRRWRDAYLDEFVFRFNRRHRPFAGFATLLGLGSAHEPVPASAIVAPFGRAAGARGRATVQNSRRFTPSAHSPAPPVDQEPEPNFSHEVREHETEIEFIRAVARLAGDGLAPRGATA